MSHMPSYFAMLVLLLGGSGGNDLLDYAQTNVYWKAANVTVAVEPLTKELAIPTAADVLLLIKQLGAEDPSAREVATQKIMQAGPGVIPQLQASTKSVNHEIATRAASLIEALNAGRSGANVRRLMAIRALAELKDPQATASLKPLLTSSDPFIAEYAGNAIATIEGRAPARAGLTASARLDDLHLLPAKMDAVAQFTSTSTTPKSIALLVAGANILPPDQVIKMVDGLTSEVTKLAAVTGNVRLNLVTAGVFTNAPNAPGYGIFVLRGQWDSAALTAAITERATSMGAVIEMVDGFRVFRTGQEAAVIIASDERIVALLGDTSGQLPIADTVAAIKKGSGEFATNADMAKLLANVDRTVTFWVAANVNAGIRQEVMQLRSVDTAWLTANRVNDVITFKCHATGKDPAEIKSLGDEANFMVQQGIAQLPEGMKVMPQLLPAMDFLKSIKITVDGGTLSAAATLKDLSQLLLLAQGWQAHAEVIQPVPPPVVVPPK